MREKEVMSQRSIVVIDNDEVTLEIVKAILAAEGYGVRTAVSAVGANEHIYGNRPPDLILLDVMMPFLDGPKKIEFLKERESSRDIPVVLISSKSRTELSRLARQAGAVGFVSKPIGKEDLLAEVSRHLG